MLCGVEGIGGGIGFDLRGVEGGNRGGFPRQRGLHLTRGDGGLFRGDSLRQLLPGGLFRGEGGAMYGLRFIKGGLRSLHRFRLQGLFRGKALAFG